MISTTTTRQTTRIAKIRIALAFSAAALLAVGIGAAMPVSAPTDTQPVARAIRRMDPADPAKVDAMARLLAKAKETPASAYSTLPDETTPTESRLVQVLAYLQNVRPTDRGDGPTGAVRIGRLIKEAASEYKGFLGRRLKVLSPN